MARRPQGGTASSPPTLARLMTWLSPAYPVGGFSYSHGLEWIVETGGVRDAATLGDWIEDVLRLGAGRTDAIFLAEAWRAVAGADTQLLHEVAELAAAFAPSAERHLETMAQGTAFLTATQAVWPHPALAPLHGRRHAGGLSGGGRRQRGRARPAAAAHRTGLRAGVRRQPGLGRRAPDPARADRRPARHRPPRAAHSGDRHARAGRRASTMPAARRSPPMSPRCATRRSTRGCSAPSCPRRLVNAPSIS